MRYPGASQQQVKAPEGKFRLIALDLDEGSRDGYNLGDFDALEAAKQVAEEKSGVGHPVYVYNDKGELVMRFGSWH